MLIPVDGRFTTLYRYSVPLSVILGTAGKVAASEGGTCARGLRIVRPEHSMFTELVSSPWVRLRSSTNTQGSPSNRLAILPSQNASSRVPGRQSIIAGGAA